MSRYVRAILIITCVVLAFIGSYDIPRRELRSLGQVAGIALDEDGGRIKATFELYDPVVDEPIGRRCYCVVSEGDSIKECIENVSLSSGKKIYADDALVLLLEDGSEFLLQK
ncbi:MAG: hypothetical protein IJC82_08275, partial [Firmicutes bacterium]|nr:hypothetical protein [Bacillota bacterium]